jgi:hypothetical protein
MAQTESASGYGVALAKMLVEGMVSPLQPGDHGLRRSHCLDGPLPGLVGVAARPDERLSDGDRVPVIGRDKILGPGATPARALARMYLRLLYLLRPARLRAVGLSLISRFPKHGNVDFVCQKD